MKKFCFLLVALIVVPLPAVIILLSPYSTTLNPAIPPVTACFTLLLGWWFTIHQNSENFFKAETIRHKDKLITLVEKFFDDFFEKLEDRKISETKLRAFVTDRISNIEFKNSIQQKIYGKKAVVFLSDEYLAQLRMVWQFETKDYEKQEQKLQELKEDILQEIENNYIKWLK